MKLFITTAVFICFLFSTAGCKKDGSNTIRIEGFALFDAAGNDFGHYGPDDDDWTFNNTLNEKELALFDFMPADITLSNTTEATINYNGIRPYPNPCKYQQSYAINASDSVVLKLVVVNKNIQVLNKTALKFKGSKAVAFDYSDRSVYPDGATVRVYFSFSAINKPNFKAGYGDVKICEGTTVATCFY